MLIKIQLPAPSLLEERLNEHKLSQPILCKLVAFGKLTRLNTKIRFRKPTKAINHKQKILDGISSGIFMFIRVNLILDWAWVTN